jgi:hypothetical protein
VNCLCAHEAPRNWLSPNQLTVLDSPCWAHGNLKIVFLLTALDYFSFRRVPPCCIQAAAFTQTTALSVFRPSKPIFFITKIFRYQVLGTVYRFRFWLLPLSNFYASLVLSATVTLRKFWSTLSCFFLPIFSSAKFSHDPLPALFVRVCPYLLRIAPLHSAVRFPGLSFRSPVSVSAPPVDPSISLHPTTLPGKFPWKKFRIRFFFFCFF